MSVTRVSMMTCLMASAAPAFAANLLPVTEPEVSKPAYMRPFVDPVFGSTVMRITGDPGTSIVTANGTKIGTWGNIARPIYSLQEAWNTDYTRLIIYNPQGTPTLFLLDGQTFKPIKPMCSPVWDFRWSPINNHTIVDVDQTGRIIRQIDTTTCTVISTTTLPWVSIPNGNGTFGNGKGNLDDSGQHLALSSGSKIYYLKVDGSYIGPAYDVSSCGLPDCTIHNLTVSNRTGTYVIVSYDDHQQVFDVHGNDFSLTPHPYTNLQFPACTGGGGAGFIGARLGHEDVGCPNDTCSNGAEVLSGISECPVQYDRYANGGYVSNALGVRLSDGLVFNIGNPVSSSFGEATPDYFSQRELNDPSTAVVSYYQQDSANGYPHQYVFSGEIVNLPLDGSEAGPDFRRLAHHHSTIGTYDSGPFASPGWVDWSALPRVVFASDWLSHCGTCINSSAGVVNGYVVTPAN